MSAETLTSTKRPGFNSGQRTGSRSTFSLSDRLLCRIGLPTLRLGLLLSVNGLEEADADAGEGEEEGPGVEGFDDAIEADRPGRGVELCSA